MTRRYSASERELLDRAAEAVERDVERARDAFLCHAWVDRDAAAAEFYDALVELGVDVWFSERDVQLGVSLTRQLDAGLRASRIGLVLVTPGMLAALAAGGYADKELGALLATDRVIPVFHDITFDELQRESPLLASRAGVDRWHLSEGGRCKNRGVRSGRTGLTAAALGEQMKSGRQRDAGLRMVR